MNRFSGQFSEAYAKFNLPIRAYLPQINEWYQVTDRNQIFHPLYTRELIHFIKTILEQGQESVRID